MDERLTVAGEMIAAAREAGDRHAELQARNWRVADLFELGHMEGWREETARHTRLAEELRLPIFQWYTPLWAAVEAMLAGRFDDAERLSAEAEEAGVTFVKGSDFFPGGQGGEHALRLAFSFVSPDEIAEGVSVLGSLVRAASPAAL